MRRGVGIGGLQRQAAAKETFREVGEAVAEAQISQLKCQLDVFKKNLKDFAHKYQQDIKKDSLLRARFQKMCHTIGVDPLVSSKGFWAEILGVGDFYYELGIQIVESCLILQEQTGGLTDFEVVKRRISRLRGISIEKVSDDDIQRAVSTLEPLGSGYAIVNLGDRKAIQSVPIELSPDCSRLLATGQERGFVSLNDCDDLGWQLERFERTVNTLIFEGLAWKDCQADIVQFWFPCFFKGFE